jgi:hypothetical protein
MDDLQTAATNALARQAFSQLLGAEMVSISPGNAELALAITDGGAGEQNGAERSAAFDVDGASSRVAGSRRGR